MNQGMYDEDYHHQDNNQHMNQQYQKPHSNNNFNMNQQNDYYEQEQYGHRQNAQSNNMFNQNEQDYHHMPNQYDQQNYDGMQNQPNHHNNNMYAQFHNEQHDQQNQYQFQQEDGQPQAYMSKHVKKEHQQKIVQEKPIQINNQNEHHQNHENHGDHVDHGNHGNYVNQNNDFHHQNHGQQGGQFTNQLDDAEMDLPEEQSQEERQSNDNISRYIVRQNEAGVGFLRKLNIGAYGKKSVIRSKIDQLFDTLDEKAMLQNQFKTLAQYERKNQDGKPVILIKWNETQSMFELNEEVMNVFNKNQERRNSKVSFVSIAGEKGQGKTFLLNSLLQNDINQDRFTLNLNSLQDLNKQKFKESLMFKIYQDQRIIIKNDLFDEIIHHFYGNAIIMWSEPIYDKATDCEIYFLDLNSDYDSSELLREKLFFIQCIISNMLIYNVKSNNLQSNDFNYLKHLLKMQNYFEFDNLEFKEDLKYLMPKLQIVMRDFTHEIKKNGYTLSGQQYLEEYLFDDLQFQKSSQQEQKLRRRFIKYFSDRDLMTMVSPINPTDIDAQRKLENLNGLSFSELDYVFQAEVSSLRKKIISKNEVRSIRGLRFSKNMFLQYMLSFLEDTNSNEKFNLEKAISILLENEFISVYHDCVDTYKQVMEQHFSECDYMSLDQMNESLRNAREQVYYRFFRLKAHDIEVAEQFFQKYYDLLKQFIKEKEEQFHTINNEETTRIVTDMIKEKVKIIQQKTKNEAFKIQDIMFIKSEFESILNEIKNTCVGKQANYGETYGIFVTQIQRTMMDVIVNQINNTRNLNKNQLTDLKSQTQQLVQRLNKIKDDNKNHLKQNEISSKERSQAQEEYNKLLKQEEQLKASLKTHQEQLDHIKWQTGRYEQAVKDKSC